MEIGERDPPSGFAQGDEGRLDEIALRIRLEGVKMPEAGARHAMVVLPATEAHEDAALASAGLLEGGGRLRGAAALKEIFGHPPRGHRRIQSVRNARGRGRRHIPRAPPGLGRKAEIPPDVEQAFHMIAGRPGPFQSAAAGKVHQHNGALDLKPVFL